MSETPDTIEEEVIFDEALTDDEAEEGLVEDEYTPDESDD